MPNAIERLKAEAHRRSVLIVDDDRDLADSLGRMLQIFFNECVIARNGVEGFERFEDRHRNGDSFNLVVTDLALPKMGGLGLVRKIRGLRPSQPILILSAHDEAQYLAEAITLGVDGYLLKPLAMPKLLEHLETIFSKEDIGERTAAHTYDPVSGLLQLDALEAALSCDKKYTLLRIRVDHFRGMIRHVGEEYANSYLRELVRLLNSFAPKSDGYGLFHVALDEFCLLMEPCSDARAMEIAGEIIGAVKYFYISEEGIILNSSLSIGIAAGCKELLHETELALEEAIASPHGSFALYRKHDRSADDRILESQSILRFLFEALNEENVIPFFQPVYSQRQQQVTMYESLVRIRKDGIVYGPDSFLDMAQNANQMMMVTRAMIRKSFAHFAETCNTAKLSVNLSSNDLRDESLLFYIGYWAQRHGIDPSRLLFEVPEAATLHQSETARTLLENLKKAGYGIVVDDFGSGGCNLPVLMRLAPDYIKIDSALILKAHHDPAMRDIVVRLIEVIRLCGAEPVAKHVSTPAMMQTLTDDGIDYIQGYAVGEPSEELL